MNLYFAYGSNMDQVQMNARCPGAALVGNATLNDYSLGFTIFSPKRLCGCADIIPSQGSVVYGLLYTLTDADLYAMDEYEGCPSHYQRIMVRVNTPTEKLDVYSYEVVNKQSDLKPSEHYLGLIRDAAALHNFPKEYQMFLETIKTL